MAKVYLKHLGWFLIGAVASSLISFFITWLLFLIFRNEVACFVASIILGLLPAYFCGIWGVEQDEKSYFLKNKVKTGRAMVLLLPCFCLCFSAMAVMLAFVIMGFDKIYSGSKALVVVSIFGALLSFSLCCGLVNMLDVIMSKCPKCHCVLSAVKIGECDHQEHETTETKTKNYSGTSKVGSVYSGGTKVGDVYQDYSTSQNFTRTVIEKSHNNIMQCVHCGKMVKRKIVHRETGKWH